MNDVKSDEKIGIKWPKLIRGTLIKRYKRFLADIRLDDGTLITAHCPNSGSMKTCSEPGRPVFVSQHDNPKRKYQHTWELIEMPTSLVGVNTQIPNKLVKSTIENGLLDTFRQYDTVKAEPRLESGSRLDLLLSNQKDSQQCYIEIKNCTLVKDRIAFFPDAVTSRGTKHLKELVKIKDENTRCVMFFLIQRMDADIFRPADEIDPEYGETLRKVYQKGVEIAVFGVKIDLKGIAIHKAIPFEL